MGEGVRRADSVACRRDNPTGVGTNRNRVRVESGLFFANADFVSGHLRAAASKPGTNAVITDAETIPAIDVTAVGMLIEVTDDKGRMVARGQVRLQNIQE